MTPRSRSRQPSLLITVIVLLGVAAFYAYQNFSSRQAVPASTPAVPAEIGANPASSQGIPAWLKVYFTDPNPPDNLGHGIDRTVKEAIDSAKQSVDVTSFDLNLPDLVNALADAAKRGVKVRVVYDGTNGSQDVNNASSGNQLFNAIPVLKAAGVGLVDGGRSSGLMHDKIVIVDGKELFAGSWNLSYNDTYRNNNNLLAITDPRLIANYQAKFNELFVDKRFGTHARLKVPNPSLTIDGVAVENYFSPEDGVMSRLVSLVQNAKKSVHFMIFTFTDKDLASAMIARAQGGVDVKGVIENRGASNGALVPLYCAKLPVKVDGNKYTMHHKVIVLDDNTVITGSFNFTQSADKENDDHVIVIHSPAVAAAYEQEFQKIYGQGQAPSADLKCK
jgi:phosphatidylserine/phosphatidylglycerophosphate/cardiolipin synthase-like enzyme